MGKKRKTQKKAAGDEQICTSTIGVETRGSKSRKKITDMSHDETGGIQPPNSIDTTIESGSADIGNKRDSLTEIPSLITSNKLKKKKKLPPDEERCGRTSGGGWRCKNFKMGHGAAADDDTTPRSNFCEKHYNSFAEYNKKKKRSGDSEGAGSGPVLEKQLPPDEERCCHNGGGWRCKNFKMGHGAAADDDTVPKTKFCEKHYNYYSEYKKKKKRSGDGDGAGSGPVSGKQLPPDEERCCHTNGGAWRCKNFKMGHGAAADDDTVPMTKFCEKHYNYYSEYKKKKKTSGDGEGAGSGPVSEKLLPPDEERCCHTDGRGWRCKKFRMGHGADDDHSVPKTKHCEKHYNYFAQYEKKRTRKKKTSGDGEDDDTSDTIVEGGSDNNGRKRKHAERMSRYLESFSGTREAADELESLEHHKSKSVELQKKKAECTELVKKAKKKKTRKTTSTDENEQTLADATERWKKLLLSCLQSKVNEKSTRGCGESRISNPESLVFRSGKESSIMRCVELGNSERVESEVPGLQNDITQSCENPTDESNRSKLNAETSVGGRKDSHLHECKTKEKVLNVSDAGVNKHNESESEFPEYAAKNISSSALHLSSEGQNVEEGEGWGSSSNIPPQHGSSSQDHLEMSTVHFANLVSDDGGGSVRECEHFDSSLVSKNSIGDPLDMPALKNWNWNKEEIKWKSEADMLSSFEEDADLCMKAICALYRQEISEDEISPKELLFHDDTLRCTALAKFLMDNDCKGDLKKSVAELEKFDSKAVGDCKKLVRRYSIYLFDIYQNRKDPFFLPATTAGHGDQTSK